MPQTAQQGYLRPCAGARVAPFQVAACGGQEAFRVANLGLALGVHVGFWCPGLLRWSNGDDNVLVSVLMQRLAR